MATKNADWNNPDNWESKAGGDTQDYIGPEVDLKTAAELGACALGYSQAINDALFILGCEIGDMGIDKLKEMRDKNGI